MCAHGRSGAPCIEHCRVIARPLVLAQLLTPRSVYSSPCERVPYGRVDTGPAAGPLMGLTEISAHRLGASQVRAGCFAVEQAKIGDGIAMVITIWAVLVDGSLL